MYIKITSKNQINWNDRILSFNQRGRVKGLENFNGMCIPIGYFVKIYQDLITILRPKQIMGTCRKCSGIGTFYWGQDKSGPCHDCKGKGTMTVEDEVRDEAYHEIHDGE